MHERQSMLMTMSCRGGCRIKLTTLAQPIHAITEDDLKI